MKEIFEQIANKLIYAKEDAVRAAITSLIGGEWCMQDMKGRGRFNKMPDGTEVFNFDGVDLLRFHPIEIYQKEKLDVHGFILGNTIEVYRQCELLYKGIK